MFIAFKGRYKIIWNWPFSISNCRIYNSHVDVKVIAQFHPIKDLMALSRKGKHRADCCNMRTVRSTHGKQKVDRVRDCSLLRLCFNLIWTSKTLHVPVVVISVMNSLAFLFEEFFLISTSDQICPLSQWSSRNEYPLHKLIKFTTQPVRSCDPPEYFQFESSRQCLMFEDTVSSIES